MRKSNGGGFSEERSSIRPWSSDETLKQVLDGICTIIADRTAATTVFIGQRDDAFDKIDVMGRYGTLISEMDVSFAMPQLNAATSPTLSVPDLRTDPRFSNHPLLKLMPQSRSLIALILPGLSKEERAVLQIINPKRSVFTNAETWRELSKFCEVIAKILRFCSDNGIYDQEIDLLKELVSPKVSPSTTASAILLNSENASEQINSPSISLLFDTLVKKRVLHSRNGVSFITMRSWRGSIKEYQISALVALKKAKSHEFVSRVASELAEATQNLHGQGSISCVVPIPGGNSGDVTSFSVLVANEVAKLLKVTCVDLLVTEPKILNFGKSSPRKSAALQPYTLSGAATGPILVVDDVVSSGKHMELAISCLKKHVNTVYGIAWIGK